MQKIECCALSLGCNYDYLKNNKTHLTCISEQMLFFLWRRLALMGCNVFTCNQVEKITGIWFLTTPDSYNLLVQLTKE